jgi:chromosome-anchoring protein RacA
LFIEWTLPLSPAQGVERKHRISYANHPNGVVDMDIAKTKDASELVGVSQTTIKRWASQFPSFFQKDRFGHYVFSEKQISLLIYIRSHIERGDSLDQITLPINLTSEPAKKQVVEETPMDELFSRIHEIERSLGQKADEVVSSQVLQHRSELEELRQMISQLAATVEIMQNPSPKSFALPVEFYSANADKPLLPARKRGFFRSFFTVL